MTKPGLFPLATYNYLTCQYDLIIVNTSKIMLQETMLRLETVVQVLDIQTNKRKKKFITFTFPRKYRDKEIQGNFLPCVSRPSHIFLI